MANNDRRSQQHKTNIRIETRELAEHEQQSKTRKQWTILLLSPPIIQDSCSTELKKKDMFPLLTCHC